MVASLPPPWFSEAALTVESLGFFSEADAPSNGELWALWHRDGAPPTQQPEHEVVLRILSLDASRCWRVNRKPFAPARGSELVRTWFDKLATLSEGHLHVEAVEEIWVRRWLFGGHKLARLVFRANDATLSVAPVLDDGGLALRDLLAMANAALTFGSFVTIRPMADAADVDWDLVCWVEPKKQQRLAELGLDASAPPTAVEVFREGRLRQTAPPPAATTSESLFAKLEHAAKQDVSIDLASLRKPAWRPKVRDGEQPETIDKFGGVPWLPARKRMPKCPTCKGPTSQSLQLSLASLPLKLGIDGTLQVFLCAGEDPGACFTDHGGFVIRLEMGDVKPRGNDPAPRRTAKSIVGWEEIVDEPGSNDWPTEISYEACEDFFDGPVGGDKCGGYGHYPQGGEPRCLHPRCDKGQLVFQLESSWEGILENAYFGDHGKLFIYVCTDHSEPLATGHIEYY
jgi:hypothetical protein